MPIGIKENNKEIKAQTMKAEELLEKHKSKNCIKSKINKKIII